MEKPRIRVLIVDDFDPFRQFVCSTLGRRPELQVIGEAADGLEAVQKASQLKPDLIVLDIGLPNLNGIAAARQIRKLSPQSRIIFLSQESSADVVQEAFDLGALGYVVKTHAGTSLLAAVETVLVGGRYVSSGVSGHKYTDANEIQALNLSCHKVLPSLLPSQPDPSRNHDVAFYSDDDALVVGFAEFIAAALRAGKSVIVVSTGTHRTSLSERLLEQGVDILTAHQQGRYFSLDVVDILPTFMVNDLPDPVRFFRVVGGLIADAARASQGQTSRVAVCGETASILWSQGKADAAIQVEQLCNRLAKQHGLDILCGFPLSGFLREEDQQIFQNICSEGQNQHSQA
ncbi:MAG: response regulator [Candidatus Sulfotelmatobacter sp.]